MVLVVKNLPTMQETWEMLVGSLGWEDPLEEGMATHSSILAWRTPGTQKPGGWQSIGLQRVGHDWSYLACMHAWPSQDGQLASWMPEHVSCRGLCSMRGVLLDPWGLRGGEITLNAVLGTRRCSAVPVCEANGKRKTQPSTRLQSYPDLSVHTNHLFKLPPWRSDSASLTSSQGMLRWLVQGSHVGFCPGTSNTWILF